jgi:hypothetical protein
MTVYRSMQIGQVLQPKYGRRAVRGRLSKRCLSGPGAQWLAQCRGDHSAAWLEQWVCGLKQTHKIDLKSTTNQEGKGFQVIP